MASNSDIVSIAKISQYLWRTQALKDSAFNGGGINENHAQVLYMERKAFEWGVNQSIPSASELNPYIYSLCGAKLQEAKEIFSSGSGGIIPSPSGSVTSLTPYTITHTVTALEAGSMSISNTDWIFLQDINEVSVQNYEFQYGKDFVFNSLSGQFNFSLSGYVLQEGDVITALGFMPSYGVPSGSTGTITLYTIYPIVTTEDSITISATIGKTTSLLLRGGIGSGQVLTMGTPTGTEILFDNSIGKYTPSMDNPFVIGEQLTIQYF